MSYEYSRQREPSVQRSRGRNRPGMWSCQSGWARVRERSGRWGQRVDSCVCMYVWVCVVCICVLLWCLGREEQLLKGPPAGIWILPYFLSLILFCSSQLNHKRLGLGLGICYESLARVISPDPLQSVQWLDPGLPPLLACGEEFELGIQANEQGLCFKGESKTH